MQPLPLAIFGASGYSGVEATRLLAWHPQVELRVLSSDRWQNDTAESRVGALGAAGKLRYADLEQALEQALDRARGCKVAMLCTPAEGSLELAPRLLEAGLKVIDLSGAFRLEDPLAYQAAYRNEHTSTALLAEAVYGLPELGEGTRAAIRMARLVSNPGCYPTAAALALAPLLEAGLLTGEAIVVDAASGTSGAGRKATEEMSFTEVDDDFRAYRVLRHQHTPEIVQTVSRAAKRPVALTFTPHLLPVRRGILSTAYARLAPGREPGELRRALLHKYAGAGGAPAEPFVTVAGAPDQVSLRAVVGTNRCQVAVDCGGAPHDPNRVVVVSSIDNLIKGAAGQAVQNLNLMMGWDETTGLSTLRGL
jgi:N-acetyl-gamma-glutamyl-phosphate reductase